MKVVTFLIIIGIMFLLVGGVSAFVCTYESDNDSVKDFKNKVNILAVKHDLQSGVSPEAIKLKAKYLNPCS